MVQCLDAKSKKDQFNPAALVTVGMVETVKRRLLLGYVPGLIVIDECHKGNFTKVMDLYPSVKVIGATATPVGKHIPTYYHRIVNLVNIPILISQGYLAPCKAFQMQEDLSDLKVKGGEYTDDSLYNHFNKRKMYTGVVDEWVKRCGGEKTIVFNVNIEHAEQMHQDFLSRGIQSEVVTSKTPKEERRRILAAFKAGLVPVLNNCGILTTGYDEPTIRWVIVNRATKSLPLWLQMCGRGSRTCEGKSYFGVLDFGMNHDEHGLWEEPRDWSLDVKKKKDKEKAPPTKDCPQCEAMLPASVMKCKHCGYEFERKETEMLTGKMVEIKSKLPDYLVGIKTEELTAQQLWDLQQSKRFSHKYVWSLVRQHDDDFLKEFATIAGYKWSWRQEQKRLRNQEQEQNKKVVNFTLQD